MNRGLEKLLEGRAPLEQKLIIQVAEKLNSRGFPLEHLTRIDLENPVEDLRTYYQKNEITFLVNPIIYDSDIAPSIVAHLTTQWEDSATVYEEDGSVIFRMGKIPVEDLELHIYALSERYHQSGIISDTKELLGQIDELFATHAKDETPTDFSHGLGVSEGLGKVCSHNLDELLVNHFISIKKLPDLIWEIDISPIRFRYDESHPILYFDYTIHADLEKRTLKLITEYDPTFMPTPMPMPDIDWDGDGF